MMMMMMMHACCSHSVIVVYHLLAVDVLYESYMFLCLLYKHSTCQTYIFLLDINVDQIKQKSF